MKKIKITENQLKLVIKEVVDNINDLVNERYSTTLPTFERLKNMDGLKEYSSNRYKIVRFALDDEGSNGFALLDMATKKLLSWSISGSSQVKQFKDLNQFKDENKNILR